MALYAYAPNAVTRDNWVDALQAQISKLQPVNQYAASSNAKPSSASRGGSSSSSAADEKTTFAVSGTQFYVTKNYKLIKNIGQGAYGVVISALDENTGQKVAIKKVAQAFEDLVDAKRILREIALLQHFDHENIVSVTDIVRPDNIHSFDDIYIVSELMETDLHRVIYSRQALTDEHVQYFLYQLLRGLKYLHSANVLHRDLKPSNLLVNSNCDLKICDFGLSRGMDQEDSQNEADMTEYVVTRWYRAPEIMLAVRDYGPEIDTWAAGCILAELMARKPLFPGNDYIHQLKIITEMQGSPSDADLEFVTSDKARRFMRQLSGKKKTPWDTVFPNYENPEAFSLLDGMLSFDPRRRISIDECLSHPYLEALHHEDDEPSCEKPFDFSFAKSDLTKKRLRELMYERTLVYHPL